MKKVSYFLSLACAALLASCSSDVDELNVNNSSNTSFGNNMTVSLGMPGADGTRVEFGNEIKNLKWNIDDKIAVIAYYQNEAFDGYYNGKVYSIDNNVASINFQRQYLNSNEKQPCNEYRFVYFSPQLLFKSVRGVDEIDCNFLYQNFGDVAGESDFDHIKDHLYMTTQKLKVLSEKSVQGGNLVPQCAVLKLNVQSLPTELQNKSEYNVKFFVNYADGVDPIAAIKYKHAIESGKSIYLAFDPVNDLTAGANIGFEISDKDETVTYKVYAKSESGKNYEKAKIYSVSFDAANLGVWKSSIVKKDTSAKQLGYTESFAVGKGDFTIEGLDNIWSFGGAAFVSGYQKVSSETTSCLVSPVIQLGTNNVAKFNSNASMFAADEDAAFCIRTVGGQWEDLDYVGMDGTLDKEIAVDGKYDNKLVQFGFRYHTISSNSSGDWYIKDFSINGTATK